MLKYWQLLNILYVGAQLAEKNQHHPDWRNLWNTVDITLTTDDKFCLSNFDIFLASGFDYLFNLQSTVAKA